MGKSLAQRKCKKPNFIIYFTALLHVFEFYKKNYLRLACRCAQDRYLLGNLNYTGDLQATKESWVFKFADRVNLHFQCQIGLRVKEPNGTCQVCTGQHKQGSYLIFCLICLFFILNFPKKYHLFTILQFSSPD